MDRESLIKAGFTEEQVNVIIKMHQQAIDGNFVPKATFNAERDKNKALATQIADRDKQITELGAFKGTAEELQTKVSKLEEQNKADKEKYEADLLQAEKTAAIRFDIASSVIDPEDILPKLDQTKIVFKDGKIVSGLTEQLDALKTAKPHYFKTQQSNSQGQPSGWIFGKTPVEGTDDGGSDSKSEAQKFGEFIANSKMSGSNAAGKAADVYFK